MEEQKVEEQDVDQGIADADAQNASSRASEIAAIAPDAKEPLSARNLSVLAEVTAKAANDLTGGQLGATPIQIDGDMDKIPDELFAQVSAMAALTKQGIPEVEKYQFDPQDLSSSNSGLMEMSKVISAMGSDKAAQQAMNRQAGPGGETPDEEAQDTAPEGSKEDKSEDEDDMSDLL